MVQALCHYIYVVAKTVTLREEDLRQVVLL